MRKVLSFRIKRKDSHKKVNKKGFTTLYKIDQIDLKCEFNICE